MSEHGKPFRSVSSPTAFRRRSARRRLAFVHSALMASRRSAISSGVLLLQDRVDLPIRET